LNTSIASPAPVPSPKFQLRDAMPLSSVDAVLLNAHCRPVQLVVNCATGGWSVFAPPTSHFWLVVPVHGPSSSPAPLTVGSPITVMHLPLIPLSSPSAVCVHCWFNWPWQGQMIMSSPSLPLPLEASRQ
jgi:hypothetical protein